MIIGTGLSPAPFSHPLEKSTKSDRDAEDRLAPMGMGATNCLDRLSASIFLLLALMALARLKTVESLRYCAPGEWGKLLGLDRIPECGTVRDKIHLLTSQNQGTEWARQLSSDWIADQKEVLASFYIDGHVRVYYGSQTELPRHYVSRQKLCLRATTDYWVNAKDGQPFLVINKAIDPGMLKVLTEDIVPRLEQEIPDTTKVVNPAHRSINSEIRQKGAILHRTLAQFGSITLDGEIQPEKVAEYLEKKAKLQEKIFEKQKEIEALKAQRKQIPSHIEFAALPKEKQFKQIHTPSQDFIDTIKMVAYRAETAMVQVLREKMSRLDDGRSLVRAIYNAEADLIPNEKEGTLSIYLHNLANHSSDSAVQHLCHELNETETIFPGTNLRLVFILGSSKNQ